MSEGYCLYSRKKPNKKLLKDVSFAITVMKELSSRISVWQGIIVVKKQTVMSIQAAESDCDAVKRGCSYAVKDAVVVLPSYLLSKGEDALINIMKTAAENKASLIALDTFHNDTNILKSSSDFADNNNLVFIGCDAAYFYDEDISSSFKR